jgi:very-short-patch-repair endonuclease
MRDVTTSRRVDTAIAAIATKQHGVFSFTQVAESGGDSRLVYRRIRSGIWLRISDRAFALVGSPLSFDGHVMAACLTAGANSYASHATAAELWLRTGMTCDIHLWAPRRVRAAGLVGHVGTLERTDVTRLAGIPITRPERTLVDLASTLREERLEGLLDEFLRRELAQLPRLERRLNAAGVRQGVRRLRRLVEERRGSRISESELETRLLRALGQEGLSLPIRQYEIRDRGQLVARADFAYPQAKLVIEAYGRRHHSVWTDQEYDLARQNELTALGWRVIVVTWSRLHRERAQLMQTIARALST